MRLIRTILHPTDFSSKAERAFELACELAQSLNARIVVLHAAPSPLHPWSRSSRAFDHGRKQWQEARERLYAIDAGRLEIQRLIVAGEPASAIIRAAHELDTGLIVMGAPRRIPWRWLHGPSIAETVIFEAPCPVLTSGEFTSAAALRRDRWDRAFRN